MSENPYASPSTDPNAFPDDGLDPNAIRIASQGKRFLNLVIDTVAIQVLSVGAGFVVGGIYATADGTVNFEDETSLTVASYLIGYAISVSYYAFMEIAFQKTVAKFLTGTLVVTATGERPSFGQIIGRSFARCIPFEAFSFLFGQKPPVGWHDSLSGTRVISTR